jgi:hypothetical protein
MTVASTLQLRTVWAVLIALMYATVGVGGLLVAGWALRDPQLGVGAAAFLGLPPLLVAAVMVPLHLALPWLRPSPRTWMLTLVLLIISAVGTCPPLAVVVLVGWLGPEVKAAHGR